MTKAKRGIYFPVWQKYLPALRKVLKKAIEIGHSSILVDKNDFQRVGSRIISGYAFSIRMENGHAMNNLSGTRVGKTLAQILCEDLMCKKLHSAHKVRIRMDKDFFIQMEGQ